MSSPASDAMKGFNVLHPIGWDALGMPAENAAIKHGTHPQKWTMDNVAHMKAQLKRMGFATTGPARSTPASPTTTAGTSGCSSRCSSAAWPTASESWVNWCPPCSTVLANEQVVGGVCWRCETPVDAEEDGAVVPADHGLRRGAAHRPRRALGKWPEHVLLMQKNWIGRSEGAYVRFPARRHLEGRSRSSPPASTRSTVRPSSSSRAEHPLVADLVTGPKEEELARLGRRARSPRCASAATSARPRRTASTPARRRSTPSPASASPSGSPITS